MLYDITLSMTEVQLMLTLLYKSVVCQAIEYSSVVWLSYRPTSFVRHTFIIDRPHSVYPKVRLQMQYSLLTMKCASCVRLTLECLLHVCGIIGSNVHKIEQILSGWRTFQSPFVVAILYNEWSNLPNNRNRLGTVDFACISITLYITQYY